MKYTLLELVQHILASMQGDAVTDIGETEESTTVALIVKENYFYITGKADLPEHKELFTLTSTSSSTPTIMTPPSTTTTIEWLKYNMKVDAETDNNFAFVTFMNSKDFFIMQNGLDSDESTVDTFNYTIGSNTFNFKYTNDRHPLYYTVWNDSTVIFDSIDLTEETYLHADRTLVYGLVEPTWTHNSNFTPDLDARQFNLLLSESKAQAFAELKQAQNTNAERKIKHGWVELSRGKNNLPSPINAYSKIKGYGKRTR